MESSTITLGARGDSYYEYLLKQYLFSGKRDEQFLQMYLTSVDGICNQLVRRTSDGLTFVGEVPGGDLDSFSPKMDHLVCFLPGTLALGHAHGLESAEQQCSHLPLALELMETCLAMYSSTSTGLSPEIVWFDEPASDGETEYGKMRIKSNDRFSLLRPETIESLFILWRVTRDQRWRDEGWKIFQAINQYARLDKAAGAGFSSLDNVMSNAEPVGRRDKMESFFVAETLKYLFLLFDDDDRVFPLNQVVLNTEAHPFPIF